ncbi:hypothetical protein F2981_20285 (plasmid) [Sinorhizobium meliloti]|nr:hypothetical protein [Sinorhizobium meliloti]
MLDVVLLSNDVLALAVRSTIDPTEHEAFAGEIVGDAQRASAKARGREAHDLVVFLRAGLLQCRGDRRGKPALRHGYRRQPMGEGARRPSLLQDRFEAGGLHEPSTRWGWKSPRTSWKLFRDLPPDHPFFQQLTFMTAEEIPAYEALLQKVRGKPLEVVSED